MGRSKDAQAKYRTDRKNKAVDYLGGKCINCGSFERLEFDHIDTADKLFNIGGNLLKNEAELFRELDKCQLLCHDCHIDKTLEQRGYNHAKHGTYTMYNNYKCRCLPCRKAWASYHQAYRTK